MSESLNDGLISHKNDKYVHFQKINIFGDPGVGKTSLISYIENYDNSEYTINPEEIKNADILYFEDSSSLVEDIKRIVIDFNPERYLYFHIYKSNLNRYDSIKMNLDTLLLQTECIIIMWDNNNPETFDNIPNFITTIEEGINNDKFRKVPIFVIQNKMDLNLNKSNISIEEDDLKNCIDNLKKEHPNIIYIEMTLFDKEKFYDLILEIFKKIDIVEMDLGKDKYKYENDWVLNNAKFPNPILNIKHPEKFNIKYNINCLLLGNSSVGKTSFVNSLMNKDIIQAEPTARVSENIFLAEIFDEKIFFYINDISGQEKDIQKSYFKNSDGILLFFDVTNEESFNQINSWISLIEVNKGNLNYNYELLLIGNKIDDNDKRQVPKQTAKKFAERKNIKYFECSCLKKINIYEIFNEITFKAYQKYKDRKEKNPTISLKKKKIKKKKKIYC